MSGHYLPNGEREREGWLLNFSIRLQSSGTALGLSAAEVTGASNDYQAYKYMLDIEDIFKAELHTRTSYKDLLFNGKIGSPITNYPTLPTLPTAPTQVAAGIIQRTEMLVQKIKNSQGYNETEGQSLRIIAASGSVIDKTVLKPTVKVFENNSEHVLLKWTKGEMDGVIVYVNAPVVAATTPAAGTEADAESAISWVEYTRCTISPFTDTRKNKISQPETRLYKMKYFKKDIPEGIESDIIKVAVAIY